MCREGVSVDELKMRHLNSQKTPLGEPTPNIPKEVNQVKAAEKPKKVAKPQSEGALPYKPLKDIVQLDKFVGEDKDRIAEIWNQYHSQKDGFVSGVMTAKFYSDLQAASRKYPMVCLSLQLLSDFQVYCATAKRRRL